jgi:hypothetical protein
VDTITGHATELCCRGHEECTDSPGGPCWQPEPIPGHWPTWQEAADEAGTLVVALGHDPLRVLGDPHEGCWVYTCSCSLAVMVVHEPAGWCLTGLALTEPHTGGADLD